MLINKMFNIKYPIFGGPMANISNADFAASTSNAGGIGIIATAVMTPEEVRIQIRKCKDLTKKPFGVNLMLMNPHTSDIVDVVCEEKVALVTTGAGNPGVHIAKLQQSGAKVFPVISNCTLAKRLERYNVDGFIAEGTESGGHVGESTTFTLMSKLRSQTDLPIVAAGGIANGKGFNAALALGACGVQVGTMLLVSNECPIHDNYKQAVVKAKDSDTVVTGRSLGVPVRIMKNKMSKAYIQLEKEVADAFELEHLTLGAFKKAVLNGDMDNGSVMMGQVASICNEVLSIEELFDKIILDAKNEKEELLNKINSL